jgi:SAM-dependent methyltransferase
MTTSSKIEWQDTEQIRERVRQRYSESARRITSGEGACCGDPTDGECCSRTADNAITSNLYTTEETGQVPLEAFLASLGCGNPTALAQLHPGETVLDLGSGGGIDVLLSARRVGPTGFAYGLDMTDEMLALAEKNRAEAGVTNVQFLKGYIESIPLPDNSVDVIISNCVINLAADKAPVLREAFRVLKPGGRFAVSDVVVQGTAPEAIMRSMEMWTGCISGALQESEYRRLLSETGFVDAGIEVTRRYTADDLAGDNCDCGDDCCSPAAGLTGEALQQADGLFVSAFIRAVKPVV